MDAPTTIVSYVHDRLRNEIITGRYPPGTRLNESQIAREYDISRIPVREALVRLRETGLVMKHDRRGMFVTELSDEEIQQTNSVRIMLEAEALRLCQLNMNDQQATKLTTLVEKMESWESDSKFDAAEMDIEFHSALWVASGNPCLFDTLHSLSTALFAHSALQHSSVSTEAVKWRLNHHRALLDVALGTSTMLPEEAVISHLKAHYDEPEKYSSLAAPSKTN